MSKIDWISVEDRLPDKNGKCLIYRTDGKHEWYEVVRYELVELKHALIHIDENG